MPTPLALSCGWLPKNGNGAHETSSACELARAHRQFVLAAAACARVVAVDVSSVMLERLEARVSAAKLSNVEVVQAGFLTYQHSGNPADFVCSRFASIT